MFPFEIFLPSDITLQDSYEVLIEAEREGEDLIYLQSSEQSSKMDPAVLTARSGKPLVKKNRIL